MSARCHLTWNVSFAFTPVSTLTSAYLLPPYSGRVLSGGVFFVCLFPFSLEHLFKHRLWIGDVDMVEAGPDLMFLPPSGEVEKARKETRNKGQIFGYSVVCAGCSPLACLLACLPTDWIFSNPQCPV